MTSIMMTDFLKSMSLLGGALLLGTFLRAKLSFFQKTFMPASVIAGFILLITGPQILGVSGKLGIPDTWYDYYSMLPGVLIIPIVAGVPLGLHLHSEDTNIEKQFIRNAIPLFFISLGAAMLQFAVGFAVHLMFDKSYEFYDQFGIELGVGFVGGHGTAGTLGSSLNDMNLSCWKTSQGVASTMATIGIMGGVLIGILMINLAARRGQTVMLDRPAAIPKALKRGFEADVSRQKIIGRETTFSTSIDALAFHTSLIFAACGCAYLCHEIATMIGIPVFKDISVWAYALICMGVIWWIMCRLHLEHLVDESVKSHITGNLTEFAVAGAIASLPVKAVAIYIIPIIVMSLLGFTATIIWLYLLCKKCLNGYWFEQMIATFGMTSGVFITGALLLRICDPELKSPVLGSYSVAYTAMSICYFAVLNLFITLPIGGQITTTFIVGCVFSVLCLAGALISGFLCFGKKVKFPVLYG
ncbi:MAG: glutamate:sodium symporter [Butyrivibrio sp.]|nr:glutamate:sodium symporter [Butyrivibrio sp.]